MLAVIIVLVALVAILVGVVAWRTYTFPLPVTPIAPVELDPVEAASVAAHLSAVIQCETVSVTEPAPDAYAAFPALHRYLEDTYPRVHTALTRHTINERSLVYEWRGTAADAAPIVFMAHQDVVPIEPSSLGQWTHPPFSGAVAEGYVWGRGTLDIKTQLVGLLESAERLLEQGFQPERTLCFAFGHDEEIQGKQGACAIVKWFEAQEIRPAVVLDEGSVVVEDVLPGVQSPIAVVGVAEKRHTILRLSVEDEPGHASMPPQETTIALLAQAIARVASHPLPATLTYVTLLFRYLGRTAPLAQRAVFANLWLMGPVVRRMLAASPQTNALIRTTTTPTIIAGGRTENVLPHAASATFDCRLMPGDTPDSVSAVLRDIIADDRVQITIIAEGEPTASRLSPWDTAAFETLSATIRQVFGALPVIPYLTAGASDARHYTAICDKVYRFTPMHLHASDLDRIHGINERVSVENLGRMVQFYMQLMRSWGAS
jgi:carboxypeptidase PM20D1